MYEDNSPISYSFFNKLLQAWMLKQANSTSSSSVDEKIHVSFSCLKVLHCCEFWAKGFLCSAELLAKARSCGWRFVSLCFLLSTENFFLYPRAATFLDSLPFPNLFKNGQVIFTCKSLLLLWWSCLPAKQGVFIWLD